MTAEELFVAGDDAKGARYTGPRRVVFPGGAACRRSPRHERRRDRRHEHQASLRVSVFNQGAVFEAQLINYSPEGMCAETGHAIRPGTSLSIRMEADPAGASHPPPHPGLRMVALGEAKWVRVVVGRGQPERYRVGIRYYPPFF
jgi:hypothetical protein